MRSFIYGSLGALLILIAASIIVPQYCEYRAQSEVSVWLQLIKTTKAEIESNIVSINSVENSGIGVSLPQSLKLNFDYSHVNRDGIIFLKGGIEGQLITLTPFLDKGKVRWLCLGGSEPDMVSECKFHKNI